MRYSLCFKEEAAQARMNIPQSVDKWIVFICMVMVAMIDFGRSTGIAFEPVEFLVISLLLAAAFTISYVVWCAFCRWLSRRLRRELNAGILRTVCNVTFFALILLAIFVPIRKFTVTISVPAHLKAPIEGHTDTRSDRTVN
jgi:hypothetical protein